MADRWYYAHEGDKKGPFTSQELRTLADAGEIVPTDTVWKEGVEQGVSAHRVKNLFPPQPKQDTSAAIPSTKVDQSPPEAAATTATETPTSPESEEPPEVMASDPAAEPDAAVVAPQDEEVPPETVRAPTPGGGRRPDHVRKARAVSGKGAMVVGQDGTYARVRKKCDKCGQEDNSVATVRIKSGNNKLFFFCRKCKRRREVVFLGIVT